MKRTRLLGKVSPGGLALFISAMIVAGVLGGYFYSTMTVNLSSDDVEINGRVVTSVFQIDGINIVGGELNLPLDVSNLTSGDSKKSTHIISNMDMGDWYVSITSSVDDITDPMDPLYGISFTAKPNNFVISPEENISVDFWWNVSHEFMDPTLYNGTRINTLWNAVTIDYIATPLCVNDSVIGHYGQNQTWDVLENDLGDLLSIVSVGPTTTHPDWFTFTITGTYPNQQVACLISNYATEGTYIAPYVISNPTGNATGYLLITTAN